MYNGHGEWERLLIFSLERFLKKSYLFPKCTESSKCTGSHIYFFPKCTGSQIFSPNAQEIISFFQNAPEAISFSKMHKKSYLFSQNAWEIIYFSKMYRKPFFYMHLTVNTKKWFCRKNSFVNCRKSAFDWLKYSIYK